jgi:Leucine-rich repeat (LRR) protein
MHRSLEDNSLSGALPGSLLYVQSLHTVRIKNNSLSDALAFKSANLMALYAGGNAFTSFQSLNPSTLRVVQLDGNNMSGNLPDIDSMPLIENFTASGCGYSGPVFDFSSAPQLVAL